MTQNTSNARIKTAAVIGGLVVLLIGGCVFVRKISRSRATLVAEHPAAVKPTPEAKPAAPQPAAAQATPKPYGYDVEAAFIESVGRYQKGYETAADKPGFRNDRRREISDALPGVRTIVGWTGILRKVQAIAGGKAAITIDLPSPNISVMTWSDATADAGARTLIEQSSELYRRLAKLGAGAQVSFDGDFLEDNLDWVKEASATEIECMGSPKFIVRFANVKSLKLP